MIVRTGIAALLLLVGCLAPTGAELLAGAAKVEITPDVKARQIPLGGYAARRAKPSTGVHDPVWARALVLSDGTTKVGIVSIDLCFLPANVRTEVAKKVEAAGTKGLDDAHLFLAATHTHSAPDPLAMHAGNKTAFAGWSRFDATLLDFTADRIAQAIIRAEKRLAPAKVGSAAAQFKTLNRNRRGCPIDDPDMTFVKVTDADGKPVAEIVNYASHPTLFDDDNMEISADWPGPMETMVDNALGGDSVCLFLNGAEGDASPAGVDSIAPAHKAEVYAQRIGQAAIGLSMQVANSSASPVSIWTQVVSLPPRKPNGLFLAAAGQLGISIPQALHLVNDLMPEKTPLTFVRIGGILLMGFPCEPTGELGLIAKAMARKAGVKTPAVVALTNDWLGYALTPEQYRQGNYEAGMSFYGDRFGPTLLSALETGLKSY